MIRISRGQESFAAHCGEEPDGLRAKDLMGCGGKLVT